jgi:hypothetical protein
MALWEYIGAWSGTTKLLLHLNWNATDSSWNGNNWTATNVSWVGGRLWSGAASFNWTTSSIFCPSSFVNNQDLTTLKWVNISSNPSSQSVILNIWTDNQSLVKLYYITTWWLQYLRLSTTDDWAYTASYQISLAWAWWVQIWTVKSWTTQKIYLNWIQVWSTWNSWTNLQSLFTQWVSVWKNNYDNTQFFNWIIDEIVIENRAWSDVEFKKQYTYQKWLYWII